METIFGETIYLTGTQKLTGRAYQHSLVVLPGHVAPFIIDGLLADLRLFCLKIGCILTDTIACMNPSHASRDSGFPEPGGRLGLVGT